MDLEIGLSRFPHLFHLFAGSPFVLFLVLLLLSHSHRAIVPCAFSSSSALLVDFLSIPLYGLDTMLKPRRQSIPVPFIVRRRLSILILVVLLIFVLNCLPSHNKRVVGGKWLPDYDVEEHPRYLHHSSYRHSPDYAFERRVSEALERIERDAITGNSDLRADDRIWQIRLGTPNVERGHDSLQFEEKNREWQYTVGFANNNHFWLC
jgi:hypothetical protein